MGTIYNNESNTGDIEFVRGSRNRCKALDDARQSDGGTEELLFAKDTGTIISGGVEYGKGVFIPSLDSESVTKRDFGNIPAGTKMSDLQFKDFSTIFEEALFSSPVNIEESFRANSIQAQTIDTSITLHPTDVIGTVVFKVTLGTVEEGTTYIENTQVSANSSSQFVLNLTLNDLKDAFPDLYKGHENTTSAVTIQNGVKTSGESGFDSANNFIWNFTNESLSVTKNITFKYKTSLTSPVKTKTVMASITFPVGKDIDSPDMILPTRNVPAFNFTATNHNGASLTGTTLDCDYNQFPITIACGKVSGDNDVNYDNAQFKYSVDGNIVTGTNAFSVVSNQTSEQKTYDYYSINSSISNSTVNQARATSDSTEDLKCSAQIPWVWTTSNGENVTFSHVPSRINVKVANVSKLLNNKYILNEVGEKIDNTDYSTEQTIYTTQRENRVYTIKGYRKVIPTITYANGSTQTFTPIKLYKNTLTIPLTLDLGTTSTRDCQTLSLQGLPESRKISTATKIKYTGLDNNKVVHQIGPTEFTHGNTNVLIGDSSVTAYNSVKLELTIQLEEVSVN